MNVALFVSAWIEIKRDLCLLLFGTVALFVSAWIEISLPEHSKTNLVVALFVSAWIEIFTALVKARF